MNFLEDLGKSGLPLLVLSLFAACDPSQQPLVFGSSNILGVDISVSPTNTQPVTATLGYKSFDLSVVPTTTKSAAGQPNPIRGCFIGGSNTICPNDGTAPAASAANVTPSAPEPRPAVALDAIVSDAPGASSVWRPIAPAALIVPPVLQGNAGMAGGRRVPRAEAFIAPRAPLSAPTASAESGLGSMRDALSVYSSFNTAVGAGGGGQPAAQPAAGASPANATINLGKVFATGVAAQFLSYGQYYFLQASAGAECVRQLANAAQTKVQESTIINICGVPAAAHGNQ